MYRTKIYRAMWGLYVVVASLVWLVYADYPDPKYGPMPYIFFFFLSIIHVLLAVGYVCIATPETRGTLAMRAVGCFFLLFWAEIISVSINSKILFDCSAIVFLGINLGLSVGAVYLSGFAPKLFSYIGQSGMKLWMKIGILSGIEAIVLLYFHTFIAVREHEGLFVWLSYSDYFPNLSIVAVLMWFWGWVIPQTHRAVSCADNNREGNTGGYSYGRVYFPLALVLALTTGLMVHIFKLQPEPVWWLLLSEERQAVWRHVANSFFAEPVFYVCILLIGIVTVWLKKQISRPAGRGKENKITKAVTSLLLAASTHMFLGTLLYSTLVSIARERGYYIRVVVPYFRSDISPTFLAYILISGILVLLNYYFEKETE